VLLVYNNFASHHLIDERCCSGSSTLSGSAAKGAALLVGVLQGGANLEKKQVIRNPPKYG
jgi:hypothetical protein